MCALKKLGMVKVGIIILFKIKLDFAPYFPPFFSIFDYLKGTETGNTHFIFLTNVHWVIQTDNEPPHDKTNKLTGRPAKTQHLCCALNHGI